MEPSLFEIRPLSARQSRIYGAVVVLLGLVILGVGLFLVAAVLQLPALQAWLMPGVTVVARTEPLGAGVVILLAFAMAMGVLAGMQGVVMVIAGRRQMALFRLLLVLLGLFFAAGFVLLALNGQSWRFLNG